MRTNLPANLIKDKSTTPVEATPQARLVRITN
jgi:hypothetical protein